MGVIADYSFSFISEYQLCSNSQDNSVHVNVISSRRFVPKQTRMRKNYAKDEDWVVTSSASYAGLCFRCG